MTVTAKGEPKEDHPPGAKRRAPLSMGEYVKSHPK